MTDMGQGCAAIFPQIAAEPPAGSSPRTWSFAEPDTAEVPDSGPTVASRTTMIVGGLIARAVAELRERVLEWWQTVHAHRRRARATARGAPAREVFREAARRYREEVGPLEIVVRHEPPVWQEFDDSDATAAPPIPTYAWGADVVEVEVDPDTLGCGRCASPRSARWGGRSTRRCARGRSKAARSRRWAGR